MKDKAPFVNKNLWRIHFNVIKQFVDVDVAWDANPRGRRALILICQSSLVILHDLLVNVPIKRNTPVVGNGIYCVWYFLIIFLR